MSKDQPANHPFIGSLVNKMDKITDCFIFRDFDAALRGMFAVFYSLKVDDKTSSEGKDLWNHLQKVRKARDSIEDTDPLVFQNKIAFFDEDFQEGYEELFNGLSNILWQGGYYANETFNFIDPAGGKKSGRTIL